jgi:hypothetical protein
VLIIPSFDAVILTSFRSQQSARAMSYSLSQMASLLNATMLSKKNRKYEMKIENLSKTGKNLCLWREMVSMMIMLLSRIILIK